MENVGLIIGAAVGGVAVGYLLNVLRVKATGSKTIAEAEKMKQDAKREADQYLREAKVSAKADVLKMKEAAEEELRERRREQLGAEKRVAQKEENLQRKEDSLDSRMKNLERKDAEVEALKGRLNAKQEELKQLIASEVVELERVAGLDRESAKGILLEKLKGEVENEAGILIRNTMEEARQRAERESQQLMVQSIQRYAGDCTYERTTATIPLPNDEMKGRIIGREGRNIRALEAATGVNILIDDTPEAVVISCFDPVRKEVARRMLEKLIQDGRIHPTRIEELL